MRSETIARNYAEALFTLGEQQGHAELYSDLIDAVAAAVDGSAEIQAVLMSPRVPKAKKIGFLTTALEDRAPRDFVLFLAAVVKRGRQQLLGEMAREYLGLLDQKLGRLRAGVTLARQPDQPTREAIAAGLSQALGREVIPSFYVDPAVLGGAVVRIGERIYDGSVRRRMTRLRRQLLGR